jgi:hypothetical protein
VQDVRDSYGAWGGGKDMKSACDSVRAGVSRTETEAAEALLNKVNTAVNDRKAQVWQADIMGAYPIVPEYLAGMPQSMRRRVVNVSHVAPVRMVMETTVSGGLSQTHIAARGAALAALAVAMNQMRPVELYAAWGLGNTSHRSKSFIGMARVETTPVSLSQAVAILATDYFARRIAFAEIHHMAGAHVGGWAIGQPDSADRNRKWREALELGADDIFIPGGWLYDGDIMVRDPVAWVNSYLDSQREASEESEY